MVEERIKSFKYELKLNRWQRERCKQFGGICRYVWNKFLEQKQKAYKKSGKKLTEFDLNNLLVGWKRKFCWLRIAPSQALQQVSKNLCQAYKNFFNGFGYPKFKRKGGRDSFRIPQGIQLLPQLSKKRGAVKLPKLGRVQFVKTREIEGKIKYATVSRDGDKWFISFTCGVQMDISPQEEGFVVAIDRGISISLQCSDGTSMHVSKPLARYLDKLASLSRMLSRRQKGSSNWLKIKKKIQKLYRHMRNKRKDDIHKITTWLANNHGIIVLEALKTKNMMKSAKGTIEDPGKNVKAKSVLNRLISDEAWNLFEALLTYKIEWRGGAVAYVDPRHTSQMCSQCGHTARENRRSQACFKCEKCAYKINADLNASKNILNRYIQAAGHAVIACGERTRVLSVKQELVYRKPNSTCLSCNVV